MKGTVKWRFGTGSLARTWFIVGWVLLAVGAVQVIYGRSTPRLGGLVLAVLGVVVLWLGTHRARHSR